MDRIVNFFLLDDLETSETGVSLFAWVTADLLDLTSEIGVIQPTDFGAGVTVDFVGIESLLAGFTDLPLPDRSRTLML